MKTRSTITIGLVMVALVSVLAQTLLASVGVGALSAGNGAYFAAAGTAATVHITGNGLNPGNLTIQAGQAVAWLNETDQPQRLIGGQPARLSLPLLARNAGAAHNGTVQASAAGGSAALAGSRLVSGADQNLQARAQAIVGAPDWGTAITAGSGISITFASTGAYDYYLAAHPNCVGQILVVGPGAPDPAVSAPITGMAASSTCSIQPLPTATASPSPTATATLTTPVAPSLQAISNPSKVNWYTVAWSAVQGATEYRLDEDDNAAFSHPTAVFTGTATQWGATGKNEGRAYYYRAQARNNAGYGPYGNTQSTSVVATPNDPSFGQQWGLSKIGAVKAWAVSKGLSVTVAVVDSGVDLTHSDLQGKIVAGYNVVAGNTNPQDDNGHGSHVAGIAAAMTNNANGVSGLGWQANIMPVKVLDSSGSGSLSNVISGIEWAADHGAQVINLSLGADGTRLSAGSIQALQAGADYAWSKGSLLVAAAGNCGDPSTYTLNGCSVLSPPSYPAALTNVLGVGATTASDTRASYSSYGSWVDVAAPGDAIYSTYNNNGYATESGTSMASPAAAGLAALVWARNPGLTNAQVANILMQSSVDLGTAGRDDQYGWGRIDAAAAVQASANAANMPAAGWKQAAPVGQNPGAAEGNLPVEPGVVLLRLKPAASGPAGLAARSVSPAGIIKVDVPVGQERSRAAELAANPAVAFAVPDYRIQWIQARPAG